MIEAGTWFKSTVGLSGSLEDALEQHSLMISVDTSLHSTYLDTYDTYSTYYGTTDYRGTVRYVVGTHPGIYIISTVASGVSPPARPPRKQGPHHSNFHPQMRSSSPRREGDGNLGRDALPGKCIVPPPRPSLPLLNIQWTDPTDPYVVVLWSSSIPSMPKIHWVVPLSAVLCNDNLPG